MFLRVLSVILACITLVLAAVFFTQQWPRRDQVSYRYEDKETRTGTIPLVSDAQGERVSFFVPLRLSAFSPVRYAFRVDSCLEGLTVNDVRVEGLPDLCGWDKWHTVNLRPYLRQGRNLLQFDVSVRGDHGSMDIVPSLADATVLSIIAAVLLGAALLAYVLRATPIAAVLAAGLLIRLAMTPLPGYEFDVGVNQGWARSAARLGVVRSYTEQVGGNMLPNYPPASIMIFGAVGWVYRLAPAWEQGWIPARILIKLPAILADLGTAFLFYLILKRARGRKEGLIGAAVYAVNPAVFYDSAVWGQTDALFTFFLVWALWLFARNRPAFSAAAYALALLTKMHAVMLLPVFAVLYLASGWRTLLKGLAGGLAVTFVVLIPFFFRPASLYTVWGVYRNSVGYYAAICSGAYNAWWALLGDSAWSKQDNEILFNLASYRTIGMILFALVTVPVLILLARAIRRTHTCEKRTVILFAAASLSALSFFLFQTEMHERYLFPLLALALPIAVLRPRTAGLYAVLSLNFFMNLLAVLPATALDRAFYNAFPALDVFVASLLVFSFVLYARFTFGELWSAGFRGTRRWGLW